MYAFFYIPVGVGPLSVSPRVAPFAQGFDPKFTPRPLPTGMATPEYDKVNLRSTKCDLYRPHTFEVEENIIIRSSE